jgi:hypothetical protein
MADVNHVISLGIGSPAAIQEFITFGLQQAEPVVVPDVVGQTQASGTTELEGEGLVVAVATAYSSTVAAGDIISQSPTAGSEVAAGSTVTITVSLGDAPVADQQPSGGWFMRFESELTRRRRRREEIEEAEEATAQLADAVDREIAQHLHADLKAEEERRQLERLRTMVAQFADREAETAMSERARKALLRAQTQANVSALLAFDREVQRMLEEEELIVLMMLVD